MTTTELIKILQDNETGAISLKPREISLTINGRYMPNPQITLSSTGDGICGAEIDLDINGEWLEQESKWISVSERLPKVNGWYQCTVQVLDLVRTMELYYKNGKWIDNRRVNMFETYDIYGYAMSTEKHKLSYEELRPMFDWTIHVIAWKPLSEPYKAESEEV